MHGCSDGARFQLEGAFLHVMAIFTIDYPARLRGCMDPYGNYLQAADMPGTSPEELFAPPAETAFVSSRATYIVSYWYL